MLAELKWDTEFFGFKVGKITVPDTDEVIDRETLCEYDCRIRSGGFRLVYLFVEENSFRCGREHENLLSSFAYVPADRKIIYEKRLAAAVSDSAVTEFSGTDSLTELYALAMESGHLSRYKLDRKFPAGTFENLYREWIDNSLNGQIADKVLVYKEGAHILGFVTVKVKGNASIGLIATDARHRGKGVGKELLRAAENFAFSSGSPFINVATQEINGEACRFYERAGYSVCSTTRIFHKWV